MKESARQARNAYYKAWRAKNKDKVKANNERYWEKKAQELEVQELEVPALHVPTQSAEELGIQELTAAEYVKHMPRLNVDTIEVSQLDPAAIAELKAELIQQLAILQAQQPKASPAPDPIRRSERRSLTDSEAAPADNEETDQEEIDAEDWERILDYLDSKR